ncbi:hypothetical protein B1690_08720 [Geobacillus sp. 46C-IIa]|nr:hypothetical protein B1690_08720 [Geobacillus sp. 46C-IIa]
MDGKGSEHGQRGTATWRHRSKRVGSIMIGGKGKMDVDENGKAAPVGRAFFADARCYGLALPRRQGG